MVGILTSYDLGLAERLNWIRVFDKIDGSISIDVQVARLFRQRKLEMISLDPESEHYFDKIEPHLWEEVSPVDGKWVLLPNEYYKAVAVQKVSKVFPFAADLNTRSSWARYGLDCRGVIDELRSCADYEGELEFCLRTMNTSVILRPGDSPAQLWFAHEGFIPLMNYDSPELVDVVKGAEFTKYGFTLTRDRFIQMYKGGIIDSHKNPDDHFETVDINDGFAVNEHMFFLSASQQHVRIPNSYVGHLHYTDIDDKLTGIWPPPFPKMIIHRNAPFVDPFPRFEGKLTFENNPIRPHTIQPGQRIGELMLMPLLTPYFHKGASSRYKGQNQAQLSKGHIDANP